MGALTLLDTSKASYLKGTWEGYQTALADGAKRALQGLPTDTEWQGNRASWWHDAQVDLAQVSKGISVVLQAIDTFIVKGAAVQAHLDLVEGSIRGNCTDVSASINNSISGNFTFLGRSWTITVTGASILPGVLLPDLSQQPPWLATVRQALDDATRAYFTATTAANAVLSPAKAIFNSMQTFTHLPRSAANSDSLVAADDPTWVRLTNGQGIFRPVPPGFSSSPFSTTLMPDWYDPTTGQKISKVIGELQPLVDLGAIVLAAVGQPEAGVVLEVLVHGSKLTIDAAEKKGAEVAWDTVDLVLDFGGLQTLAEKVTEQVVGDASRWPGVNAAITSFVQARLREAVPAASEGGGTGHLTGATLSQITAEAQGQVTALTAGHDVVPPPPPPPAPTRYAGGGRVMAE